MGDPNAEQKAKVTILTKEQVWAKVDQLKAADNVAVSYRLAGNMIWKTDEGEVLHPSKPSAKGQSRYAAVKFKTQDGPVMFPQDGDNGTVNVEYRVISLEQAVVFTPSQGRDDHDEPPARDPKHAPTEEPVPSYLRDLLTGAPPATSASMYAAPAFNPLTYSLGTGAVVGAGVALSIDKWKTLRTPLEVYAARDFVGKYYGNIAKFSSEQHVFEDMVNMLKEALTLGAMYPFLSDVPAWRDLNTILLGRLYIQHHRKAGATATQLAALRQAIVDENLPEWHQKTTERAAAIMKLATNVMTPPVSSSNSNANKKSKKGGESKNE